MILLRDSKACSKLHYQKVSKSFFLHARAGSWPAIVERTWRTQDSQGHIPALASRQKAVTPFKLLTLRWAADRLDMREHEFAGPPGIQKSRPSSRSPDRTERQTPNPEPLLRPLSLWTGGDNGPKGEWPVQRVSGPRRLSAGDRVPLSLSRSVSLSLS